jgi:release factor glutamine methyltransferase
VELALARMPVDTVCAVADLGTGSGAIALSLAHERPHAQVLATDASGDALAIAIANAQRLAIGNLRFAQGDWCDALGDERFDLVVSNPPYIPQGDPHLGEGDLRFEPPLALASGSDGLDAIRRIVVAAPRHLVSQGSLLLEHGWDQAMRVRALLGRHGFVGIDSVRDDAGHGRITVGRLRS